MSSDVKHARFGGRIVIVGFGSIGQGVLPLLLRHIDVAPSQISILTADEGGREVAESHGVAFAVTPLRRGNYLSVLDPLLAEGDFLLNLSVDVSSIALVEFCRTKGALYLDTCIEPWIGQYTDASQPPSQRSNYALREKAMALKAKHEGGPTAILTHGANPGLVSHFVKQALLDIAADTKTAVEKPQTREDWARLSARLGVKVIHIAERDTQVSPTPKRIGEFVNTWSVDGFVSEAASLAELGWGTHERHFPDDGHRHASGPGCAIYLTRPGASTRVRSWTPNEGPYHGFLITHGEAISLADYFTVRQNDAAQYRPTVHYAYHPCDDAVLSVHEFATRISPAPRAGAHAQRRARLEQPRPGPRARARRRAAEPERGAQRLARDACGGGAGGRVRGGGAGVVRRAGRNGFRAHSRDLPPISRKNGRRL